MGGMDVSVQYERCRAGGIEIIVVVEQDNRCKGTQRFQVFLGSLITVYYDKVRFGPKKFLDISLVKIPCYFKGNFWWKKGGRNGLINPE